MPLFTNDIKIYSLLHKYVDVQMSVPSNDDQVRGVILFDSTLIQPPDAFNYWIAPEDLAKLRGQWAHSVIPYMQRVLKYHSMMGIDCYLCSGESWYEIVFVKESGQFLFQKLVLDKPKSFTDDNLLFTTESLNGRQQEQIAKLISSASCARGIEERVNKKPGRNMTLNKPLGIGELILEVSQHFIELYDRIDSMEFYPYNINLS